MSCITCVTICVTTCLQLPDTDLWILTLFPPRTPQWRHLARTKRFSASNSRSLLLKIRQKALSSQKSLFIVIIIFGPNLDATPPPPTHTHHHIHNHHHHHHNHHPHLQVRRQLEQNNTELLDSMISNISDTLIQRDKASRLRSYTYHNHGTGCL